MKSLSIIKYVSVLLLIPLLIIFIQYSTPIQWYTIPYFRHGIFSLNITLFIIIFIFRKNIDKEQFTKINISKTIAFSFILSIIVRTLSDVIECYGYTSEIPKEGISYISANFPLSVLLLAPILEELSVRIVIINMFKKRLPNWLLIVGTSLVFALLHIKNINSLVSTLSMGIVLGWLFIKTKNALLLILTYFFINLSTYIPREYYVPSLIFLLDNMLITAILIIILFVIIIINKERLTYFIEKISTGNFSS